MSELEHDSREEQQLSGLMRVLDPWPEAEARMESALFAALDATEHGAHAEIPEQSLADEWIELLKLRPAANSALVLAAAVVLYFTTPLGALAGLLGR